MPVHNIELCSGVVNVFEVSYMNMDGGTWME
jgi:hypothetical protein